MIKSECFQNSWIDGKRTDLRVTDPGLLEKCIYALQLLGRLQEAGGFNFVFKGGTSMVILMSVPKRLSIDIDIASTAATAEYEPILEEIGNRKPFLRQEEDKRGDDRLPKRRHFKFFYHSIYSRREDYVLLDILAEENHFPETRVIPVLTPFITVERDVTVRVPTIDCLAGDKLTAFAPNTVGIPLNERYNMQVAKQVFDIGELFNVLDNLEMVKEAYAAIFAAENGYRNHQFSVQQALNDTIETASLICGINLRGGRNDGPARLIQDGIRRIGSHLIGDSYRIDEARVSASKAACLAAVLMQNRIDQEPAALRYNPDHIAELSEAKIVRWPVLNRLKPISPEAFHYWHKAQAILEAEAIA